MTRTQFIRGIKIGGITVAAMLIIGYGAWRSFNYARGPAIEVFQPKDGSAISASTIEVIGRADRVNSLSVNGMSVSLDEKGNFRENLVVFPGVNIITLDAKDQFGRATEKQIEVVR